MAIVIKTRGMGWLVDVIVVLGPIFLLAGLYSLTHATSGLVWGFAIPSAFLVTGVINYLVGHALNRRDLGRHTWGGWPMERASSASFVFMLISIAAVAAHFTNAAVGWLVGIVLVLGSIVSVLVIAFKIGRTRALAERAVVAAARGQAAGGSDPVPRSPQLAAPDEPASH
jgi:hypothetical protein